MNDKESKKLDDFTKKMVKELPVEKPSVNFSKNVMEVINALETKEQKVYEPLISKKGWFMIAASFVGFILLLIKMKPVEMPTFLSSIDTSSISSALSFDYSISFSTSSITMYAFALLAFMVAIQLKYISNYYSK